MPSPELPPRDWASVIGELREENRNLRSELTEARDLADLLEFRVLELQQENDKVRSQMIGWAGGNESQQEDDRVSYMRVIYATVARRYAVHIFNLPNSIKI